MISRMRVAVDGHEAVRPRAASVGGAVADVAGQRAVGGRGLVQVQRVSGGEVTVCTPSVRRDLHQRGARRLLQHDQVADVQVVGAAVADVDRRIDVIVVAVSAVRLTS